MIKPAALPLLLLAFPAGEDYYPLKEGYVWTYAATVLQGDRKSEIDAVTRVTGRKKVGDTECFVVEIKVGGVISQEYLASDAAGVRALGGSQGGSEFLYETPIPRLKYPLAKDARWEGTARRGDLTVVAKSRVLGEEEVEAPAGRYRAFKVALEIDTPAGKTESHTWYARDVGAVKQWIRQANAMASLELTLVLKDFKKTQ